MIIKNSDPAVHNVNAAAKVNREFNLIQPKGAKPSTRTFDKPEIKPDVKLEFAADMFTIAPVSEGEVKTVLGAFRQGTEQRGDHAEPGQAQADAAGRRRPAPHHGRSVSDGGVRLQADRAQLVKCRG